MGHAKFDSKVGKDFIAFLFCGLYFIIVVTISDPQHVVVSDENAIIVTFCTDLYLRAWLFKASY